MGFKITDEIRKILGEYINWGKDKDWGKGDDPTVSNFIREKKYSNEQGANLFEALRLGISPLPIVQGNPDATTPPDPMMYRDEVEAMIERLDVFRDYIRCDDNISAETRLHRGEGMSVNMKLTKRVMVGVTRLANQKLMQLSDAFFVFHDAILYDDYDIFKRYGLVIKKDNLSSEEKLRKILWQLARDEKSGVRI